MKKKMHVLIGEDLWKLGSAKFAKVDIISLRKEADWRRRKKCDVRKFILNGIKQQVCGSNVTMKPDIGCTPSWQQFVRENSNNLGIH